MPSTTTGFASRTGHLLDVHVEIGRHLLHVVQILELLEQLDQRFGVLAFDPHRRFRNEGYFRFDDRNPVALERVLDYVHTVGIGGYDVLVAFGPEVFGARIKRDLEHAVFLAAGVVDVDLAFAVEKVGNRMRRTEIPAQSGQLVPDLGDGARRIVAQRGNENG